MMAYRTPLRLPAAAALLLGVVACEDPGVTLAPVVDLAAVRYVHVVPDTSGIDWRPIDAVENSPFALNMTFRAATAYQAMGAGARKLRLFPSTTTASVTSIPVVDTTITFTADAFYTVLHLGLARTGGAPAHRLWVLQDEIPTNIGAQVALRVVHAGVGLGPVDVTTGATTTAATDALFSSVAYGTATPYMMVSTGARALRATPTGGTTALATVAVPTGTAGDPVAGLTTIGGSNFAGSAVTAIIMPRSVAGTRAPQTAAFQSPTIVYLVDKSP
jgi:hypothetical protein